MTNQVDHKKKMVLTDVPSGNPHLVFGTPQGISGNSSPRFDLFITKLTHLIMKDGKKLKASKIVSTMLSIVHKKMKNEAEKKSTSSGFTLLDVLSQAVDNVTPSLEVRKVRVSGSTYLVPAVL